MVYIEIVSHFSVECASLQADQLPDIIDLPQLFQCVIVFLRLFVYSAKEEENKNESNQAAHNTFYRCAHSKCVHIFICLFIYMGR